MVANLKVNYILLCANAMSSEDRDISITTQSEDADSYSARSGPSCGKIWFDPDFWFGALALAAAAGAFFLNQAITMAGRRRRKKSTKFYELMDSM